MSPAGRRTFRHHHLTTAANTARALAYRVLSGTIATRVDNGDLIRTGDALARFGGDQLPDGQQSWYGRHVARAYRNTHGHDPVRCWLQHHTTGRWIHVYVYDPEDTALLAGLRSYKGTQHLADAISASNTTWAVAA